jgi:hypothetical protein
MTTENTSACIDGSDSREFHGFYGTNLVTDWASFTSLHPFKDATQMEMMLTLGNRAGIFFIIFW